jgi:hypothetical protein
MKIETKYGGDPQFAPQFICNVFEVLSSHEGKCAISVVKQFMAPKDSAMFDRHVALAVKLSLFEESNGELALPNSCSVKTDRLTPKLLSRYLCDVLIAKDTPSVLNSLQGLLLWAYSIKPVHEAAGQLTTIIPKKWEEFEIFASDTGLQGRDRVFSGPDQFPATRRWLEALGLMLDVGKETYLLSYELAIESFTSLVSNNGTPIRNVINEFRKTCPYLPGGIWNELWMKSFPAIKPPNVNAVSQAPTNEIGEIEGLILIYLQSGGKIKLEERNDAPDLMRLSVAGQQVQMVSHIKLVEKAEK